MKNKKSDLSVLIGAAFLMAASSAGPGFIAQTGTYTYEFGLSFAFVISL